MHAVPGGLPVLLPQVTGNHICKSAAVAPITIRQCVNACQLLLPFAPCCWLCCWWRLHGLEVSVEQLVSLAQPVLTVLLIPVTHSTGGTGGGGGDADVTGPL
jgi:hypothetical protein